MTLLLSSGSPSYCIWPPPAILASSCSDACTSMSPPPATLHSAFRGTSESTDIPTASYAQISSFCLSFEQDGTTACHATIQVVYFQLGCVDISWSSHAKVDLRASSCLSKFIVLLPAILISSLSVLRGLLAINSPPPTALISFSSRELVFISHTVGWRLSP